MAEQLVVPDARRGPPGSGNGGWVAGELASRMRGALAAGAPVEVTLRAPVPLDVPLEVRHEEGAVSLHHGDVVVAVAVPAAALDVDPPPAPPRADVYAVAADTMARRLLPHPTLAGTRVGLHPICFCCGAELGPDDGCHVEVSPLPSRGLVAGLWRCPPALAPGRTLPESIVWTALDCPGQFAWVAERPDAVGLLGRITAAVLRPVPAGDEVLVAGWTMGGEGRKLLAGTALYDADGDVLAVAKAI
ncbi:MAG TPA: hypothetical protein VFP61_00155, partial [Acidimicrobiales bacterium]|nr:hypothetical protein [Acidimicrobiales bacterium]